MVIKCDVYYGEDTRKKRGQSTCCFSLLSSKQQREMKKQLLTIALNYKKIQIRYFFVFLKKFIFGNMTERAATAYSMSLCGDSRLVSLQASRRVPRIVAGDKQASTNTSFDEGV